jgi:hypothetical protein
MPPLTRVDLMLVLTVLIWAFNITVTRYVLTHGFRPLAYGSIRYAAAACSPPAWHSGWSARSRSAAGALCP